MGKSGAARVKSGDQAYATAMQDHEDRKDYAGVRRRVRDVQPLVYSPYASLNAPDPAAETSTARDRHARLVRIDRFIHAKPKDSNFTIWDALQAHISGARKSKAAKKDFLQAFLQYPTDYEVTRDSERLMLRQAVEFINLTYGGNAVFHARLDRDEKGRHGVDVFFAPRYEKHTKKAVTQWISLSKFSKENARSRYGKRVKMQKSKSTGKMEPVHSKDGNLIEVWNDSGKFQGRALQDAWHEHLRDSANIRWAERGKRKQSNDPDRLSPEEYAAQQESLRLRSEIDRQLDGKEPDVDIDVRLQETAAKLINKAGERAFSAARDAAEEAAKKDAETYLAGVAKDAEERADALTQSFLSAEAREFTSIKLECERLQAETERQRCIIKLLIGALKAVLPKQLLAAVRSAFDRKWAETSPQEAPFNWGDKPKPLKHKSSFQSPEP